MALIMYWGMFGFGEMDSYISFTARRRGRWCWYPLTSESATFHNFFFQIEVYELCQLDRFTIHHNIKLLSSFLFLKNICNISTWYKIHWYNTVLKARAILHVCSKITSFFSCSLWWICYRCVVYFKVGWCGKSHQESMKVCDLAHCVTFLWCRNSRGEAFVRSFVSCYPEGFCAPYFFCSKSPGYTSVISLLHSPPSQIEDTVGID